MNDKELIILALLSGLDTDSIINSILSVFMDEDQAASKFGVGTSTIQAWYQTGQLKGFEIGNTILFLKDAADPRISQ